MAIFLKMAVDLVSIVHKTNLVIGGSCKWYFHVYLKNHDKSYPKHEI